MKKILLIFLFCFQICAEEALVIVFQAPLLQEPDIKSKVLQVKRKGEKVYVPPHFAKEAIMPEFIETYDRTGRLVYLQSKYIKVISHDEKEYLSQINYEGNDPTDYRIVEPIPKNYPFTDYDYLRTSYSVLLGNNLKSPFNYNKNYTFQDYSAEIGGRFTVTKKINFDSHDRYYFGMLLQASSVRNTFEFGNDNIFASEQRSSLKIGPIFTMDAVRTEKFRLSIGSGFTYNYNKSVIDIKNETTGYGEQRFFIGSSISPFVTSYAQLEKLIPYFDILIGADIFLNFNKKLTTDENALFPELWNSNEINEPMKPQANLYLGVQVNY